MIKIAAIFLWYTCAQVISSKNLRGLSGCRKRQRSTRITALPLPRFLYLVLIVEVNYVL